MKEQYKYFWIGLAVVIIVLAGFMNRPAGDLNFLLFDDSFYYIDIAVNSSFGQVTADGISRTNGFHPLWMWSMMIVNKWVSSPFEQIGENDLVIFTAIPFFILGYIFWFRFFNLYLKDFKKATYLTLFLILFPTSLLICLSGMETPAVMAMFGLVLWRLQLFREGEDSGKNAIYLGIAMGLLFLARTDMAIYILGFLGYLFYNYSNKRIELLKSFGVFVGTGIMYLLYNKYTAGVFFQSSGGVYPGIRWEEVFASPNQLSGFLEKVIGVTSYSLGLLGYWHGSLFVMIPLLVVGIALFYRKNQFMMWFFGATVAYFLVHNVGRFTYNIWYIQPFYIFMVVLCAYLLLNRYYKTVIISGAVALILSIGGLFCFTECNGYLKTENKIFKYWSNHQRPLDQLAGARAIDQFLKEDSVAYKENWHVGAFNSGEFGYFNQKVVNLDGLSNSDVLRYYERNQGIDYLRQTNTWAIIDVNFYFNIFSRWIPLDSFIYVGDVRYSEQITDGSVTSLLVLKNTPLATIIERKMRSINDKNTEAGQKR